MICVAARRVSRPYGTVLGTSSLFRSHPRTVRPPSPNGSIEPGNESLFNNGLPEYHENGETQAELPGASIREASRERRFGSNLFIRPEENDDAIVLVIRKGCRRNASDQKEIELRPSSFCKFSEFGVVSAEK